MPEVTYLEWKPYEGPPLHLPKYVLRGTETYIARGVRADYPKIHTAACCNYECPHCHETMPRYKAMALHMGLVPPYPAGCPVILAADKKRRKAG